MPDNMEKHQAHLDLVRELAVLVRHALERGLTLEEIRQLLRQETTAVLECCELARTIAREADHA